MRRYLVVLIQARGSARKRFCVPDSPPGTGFLLDLRLRAAGPFAD